MNQQDKNADQEKTESLVDLEVASEQAEDTTAGSIPPPPIIYHAPARSYYS